MTEDEAKTKWCPQVRMNICYNAGQEVGSWNRDGGDCNCLASKCMMWRKVDPFFKRDETGEPRLVQTEDEGYCGLGGNSNP